MSVSETGLHTRFRSLYRRSLPGFRVNEDCAGLLGSHAWVADGATGVSDRRIETAPSDAAWLAAAIQEGLPSLLQAGRGAGDPLHELQAIIARRYEAAAGQGPHSPTEAGPSACLGLIGVEEAAGRGRLRLTGRFLGDVVALVPSDGEVLRWTDERAKPFERLTLAALGEGGSAAGVVPEPVRRQIVENRARLNSPGGYWVVNPLRPWAGRELRFSAQLEPGAPVVLATDGFMRLVDVFGAYTDRSLHAALAAGRGDDLFDELRERELHDDAGRSFRRVKIHDDATVLVVAAEG
ncbi:hypothetical protein [Microvirga thermotolerans]|uniref:Protein phosphatase 2C domain-containing protein n=1 Tax=Microvirga thermotolerans TaxID=2651334 RepID=A0A5P9JX51_9HYPH|nr:hypothetical protein [Microvirga thermotolerans]QFU17167.1 hypothetical protein GDR74_13580 [Microvirga thermotolerans]